MDIFKFYIVLVIVISFKYSLEILQDYNIKLPTSLYVSHIEPNTNKGIHTPLVVIRRIKELREPIRDYKYYRVLITIISIPVYIWRCKLF